MSLFSWVRIDLKRLFRHKGTVPAVIVLPLVGLLVFAAVALPLLSTSKSLTVPYAICNEDDSDVVDQFIRLMANSESLKELSTAYPVNDLEAARALLDSDQVCVLVHAPAGFYAEMESGGTPVVELLAKEEHSFERVMVDLTLKNALAVVGQSQTLVSNARAIAEDAGVSETAAGEWADSALEEGIRSYMKRRGVLGSRGTVSPLSDYMPVEYYLSALFTFFCALSMLPAIHLTADDRHASAVGRGLLSTRGDVVRYAIARLASCGAFTGLTLALLIPVSMFSAPLSPYFGFQPGVKNLLLLTAAILLAALAFSALALLVGAAVGRGEPALWCGLYLVVLMAFLAGAIFGEEKLSPGLLAAGLWLPFRPTMDLIADTLFSVNAARCAQNMLRLLGMTALFGGAGVLLLERGRRR